MMLKTGMEVAQDYTILNYRPPRPQKDANSQYRTVVAGTGLKLAPKLFLSGNSKETFEGNYPQMD